MTEIRIHDAARHPRDWTMAIAESQFAVFHYDYKTGTWRTAAGLYSQTPEEETVLIFDTLADAQAYCRAHVEARPDLFCRIYTPRGIPNGLVETIYARKIDMQIRGPQAARRQFFQGSLLLFAAISCVWVDWRMGGPVIFGVVVGSKFLTAGLNRIVQGFSTQAEHRKA